jgi:hypothetical protein
MRSGLSAETTPFGKPDMPGAIDTSHSGFRAIQKIAIIQKSSGFIRGFLDKPIWEE